jgi:hypothetical protein
MKYLLIDDREQEEQPLLDNIAAFFWNNGNKVYCRSNFDDKSDYLNVVKSCDCIVFFIHKDCSTESFFESKQKLFHKDLDLDSSPDKKINLIFTINGVYTNAIPYPHKIFHFESLCQNELTRFFLWCEKLKLFVKCPI